MLLTIVVFLVILSVLVLVHESGHFLVGKLSGMGVEEFALGLPFTKPLWSKKLADGMKLSFYPVLFGGFVKLLGEEPDSAEASPGKGPVKGKYFYKSNVWQRIAVVVAGVTMNLFLAVAAFYLFLGLSNFRLLVPKLADYNFISPHRNLVVISAVEDNTPAQTAGLSSGEVIVSADNTGFSGLVDFQSFVKKHAGEPIKLTLSNLGLTSQRQVTVTPRKNPPAGQGALGIGIAEAYDLEFKTPGQKLTSGLSYAADMFIYNLRVLGSFISLAFKTGNTAPLSESVSGPVGIGAAVGDILQLPWNEAVKQLINLLGLLSLSLAFMNILPIPALDGGRLAFLIVEAVTNKKLAAKYENLINQAGMIILLGLILLISFNDIVKIVAPFFGK